MKKVFVDYPVSWIAGHLRYGHREGSIEMTDEEFEEFKQNPEKWLSDREDIDLDLLVDDWEIDDYDNEIEDVHWEVE